MSALQNRVGAQGIRGLTARLEGGAAARVLLLLWPWVLLAVNPYWIYLNATGYVDAWIYHGYFLELPRYTRLFGESGYYGTRISWTLVGYLAYQVLPPLLANLALRMLLFYTVVFSVYGTLALLVQRRAALLSAVLLGSYSYFLLAVGADYVDGPGIAYMALTIYLLAYASRRPRGWLALAVAGAAGAAMIVANLFLITFVPSLALAYLLFQRQHGWRQLLLRLVPLAVGGLATLAAFGLVNAALGGPFLFLLASLRFATGHVNAATNPWISQNEFWPITQGATVWPLIMLAAGSVTLLVPRLRARLAAFPAAPLLVGLYLATMSTMLAWQVRGSTPVLQAVFYISFLIPWLFLALGALLAPTLARLRREQFALLLAAAAGFSVLTLVVRTCGPEPAQQVILALALGAVALGLLILPARMWLVGSFLAAFTLATPTVLSYSTQDLNLCRIVRPATATLPADEYLAVDDGLRALRRIAPEGKVFFWYDNSTQPIYDSLASTNLYTWHLVGDSFPSTKSTSGSEFPFNAERTIALLSQDDAALAQAEQVLRARGRTLQVLGQERIQRGNVAFNLTVFQVRPLPLPSTFPQTIGLWHDADPSRYFAGGWTAADTTVTWTEGPQARLLLPFDQPLSTDLKLEFNIVSSAASFHPPDPTTRVAVLVNGTPLDTWTFTSEQPGGLVSVVVPAAIASQSATLEIVLDIDKPYSPASLGLNDDPRVLGLAVHSLTITPVELPPQPLAPDQEQLLTFAPGGNLTGMAGAGWAEVVSDARWTVGPVATLDLPFSSPPATDLLLEFDLAGTVVALKQPPPTMHVVVSTSGLPLATWVFDAANPVGLRRLRVPASLARRSATLRLTLAIDRPYTPAELGYNTDARQLGLALHAVRIVPETGR